VQPNFWQYFISLFGGMPPEVGQFLASVIGALVALALMPPKNIQSAFLELFVAWSFSHYLSDMAKKYMGADWTIETVRFGLGIGGWTIGKLVAWLLKGVQDNPESIDKLLDFINSLRKPKSE
jgi:hypothetical protein